MNIPRYKAGPVEYWIGAAVTEFINGAIDGISLGGLVGGGTGGLTAFSGLGETLPAFKQVLLAISGFAATMVATGVRRVSTWHANGNPFPNPWPSPVGNTNPPFPTP